MQHFSVLGIYFNSWILTLAILPGGMFSGFAFTGLHLILKQFKLEEGDGKEEIDYD